MPSAYSCDTSVVLPPLTSDDSVILAKNSDRPVNEAQPLVHHPRQTWASGSCLQTQYLSIPQTDTTWETIGSAPWWLWGYEMGVNEWGVTIGNEAVHTREPGHDRALIGMDLVRLGLERAMTAADAVCIIGGLVEDYGQGGPCEYDSERTYQNSFIIADGDTAWILETAGHHWVARRVQKRGAISNLLTTGATWDAGSPNVREYATAQGWWNDTGTFASAFADPHRALATSSCRIERARSLLGEMHSGVTVQDMMAVLRDHNGGDLPNGPQLLPTICMHANPIFPGETAAAMVVHIRPNTPQLLSTTCWTAFGSPCLSVFRPVYPFAVGLPAAVSIGSNIFDPASPWWQWERLQRMVARRPELAPIVRGACAELEATIREHTNRAETLAMEFLAQDAEDQAIEILRALTEETTAAVLNLAADLTITLASHPDSPIQTDLGAFWDERDQAAEIPVLVTT